MEYHPKSSRWVARQPVVKDANIVHLYKNKGEKATCDNHRGISFLSVAGKLLARILLNRITKHLLESVVSESQCGFRQNIGTVDMIFAVRQLQEKCLEQRQVLYILFIDLTKAFDTVSRPGLWSILSKLGCPPRFISMVRSLHDGMMARVIENGDVSDPLPESQLRWTGHVMRMEDNRLPKQIFCSELACGTRRQGGQTKRYKDSLKNSLRACDTPVKGWEHLAAARSAWSRQPTTEPKPSRKGDCHSYTHQTPSQERAEGQPSCCRSLPGVWTYVRTGVWSAITQRRH